MQDEVLVQYVAGAQESDKNEARGRAKGAKNEELRTNGDDGDLEVVKLPPGKLVSEAVCDLSGHWAVRFAEPNWIYTHTVTIPNDASFPQLWGLHNFGQTINGGAGGTVDADIDVPEAWDIATGSATVYVGVIDEGIDYRHPDLAGRVINPGEDRNGDGVITTSDIDGLDNDGNGKVDDVHGWDFAGNNNPVYDGKSSRDYTTDAHGTHVTGTIGGVGNNATGVSGVNWNVRVISAKFLGKSGGTTSNAIKAIDYFNDLKLNRGMNIVATNNSWGGGGSDGVGDNNDTVPSYPASYINTNIISVAAIDRFDNKAGYSNYGATSVDVGAPGSAILSTLPNYKYGYYNGTSMATPHVTGLVALLASYEPVLTAAQLKDRVLSTAVPTAALAGKCVSGGRINAYRALSLSSIDP